MSDEDGSPDGTWERPVALACPPHQPSWAIANIAPHLDPSKFFACFHGDHASWPTRWTVHDFRSAT